MRRLFSCLDDGRRTDWQPLFTDFTPLRCHVNTTETILDLDKVPILQIYLLSCLFFSVRSYARAVYDTVEQREPETKVSIISPELHNNSISSVAQLASASDC